MKLTNGYLGLVWEVPLGPDLGYGYVRFTELEDQYAIYVRILNYRRTTRLTLFSADEFATFDELVAPFMGLGRPWQKGEDRWKAIGYLPMQDADYHVPDLKSGHPRTLPPELGMWFVKRGAVASDVLKDETGESIRFQYDQVKHLGYYGHIMLRDATVRVRLEWMKILEMDYTSYEDQTISQSFLNDQKYCVALSKPYTDVPKAIRNKVID